MTDFQSLLAKSNLLSDDQFAQGYDAQQLVDQGLLTEWQAQQLLAGQSQFFLGKYKLLDKLGEGGMGAVYKAQQSGIGRFVAVKVMSKKVIGQPGAVARFHREIQTVSALNHPHIITAFDADHVGDVHFLVMEFIEGQDLKSWIQEHETLPVDWACECIRQAALGLQHAYEQGLVHRDIKPSNLLVMVEEPADVPHIKILDTGLARFTSEVQNTVLTQTGQVLGTVDYISPEQAEDTREVDIRGDIYSLGCTLFHALTGQVPFPGNNPIEKLMARAVQDPPKASTLRSDIPAGVDAVLEKMISRSPEGRYSTPAEIARALEPYSLGGDSPASQSTSSLRLPRQVSTVAKGGDTSIHEFVGVLGHSDDSFHEETEVVSSQLSFANAGVKTSRVTDVAKVFAGTILGLILGVVLVLVWPNWFGLTAVGNVHQSDPVKTSVEPASIPTGIDQVWIDRVSSLPAKQQMREVTARLRDLNPSWTGKPNFQLNADQTAVISISLSGRTLTNISPLAALKKLTKCQMSSSAVRDLFPLKGLPLTSLNCENSPITDLTHLAETPLTELNIGVTSVQSLKPLIGMQLSRLNCRSTTIRDLEPLKGMPLTSLDVTGTPIKDLSPLVGMPLNSLTCQSTQVTDLTPLTGMPLRSVNLHHCPIQKLSPLKTTVLQTLQCSSTKISSLESLRGLPLRTLDCGQTAVDDLSPLAGLPLTSLRCRSTKVKDLTPLVGMPLTTLDISETPVVDLSPLQGLPLRNIQIPYTQVRDLSPLKGMNLAELRIQYTPIDDLSLLEHIPSTKLYCDFNSIPDLAILRPLKKLQTFNGKPIGQIWEMADSIPGGC